MENYMGLKKCEKCKAPGPRLYDTTKGQYVCKNCHSNPSDSFFNAPVKKGEKPSGLVHKKMFDQVKEALDNKNKEIEKLKEELRQYHNALTTIERSGAPGASIVAKRDDGHSCAWCRGMLTPCPVRTAEIALRQKG